MKFKAIVAGLLTAILTINIFVGCTLIKEQKRQAIIIEGITDIAVETYIATKGITDEWIVQKIIEINPARK